MKLTYFDTLYNRKATMYIDNVRFESKGITFDNMGHKQFVEYEYVISIDEED